MRTDKRSQIIEQAVKIFGELGYYKTTTAQVAKAAGVTQPYIFHFFKTKEELFNAVLDQAAARIEAAFAQVEGTVGSIVKNMGSSFQTILEAHRNEVLMVMQAHTIAEPQIRQHVQEIYRKIHRTVAARFQDAKVPDAHEEAARFMAIGQFIVVIDVLNLQELYGFKGDFPK